MLNFELREELRAEKIEKENLKQKNGELECNIDKLHNVSKFAQEENHNIIIKQEYIKPEINVETEETINEQIHTKIELKEDPL